MNTFKMEIIKKEAIPCARSKSKWSGIAFRAESLSDGEALKIVLSSSKEYSAMARSMRYRGLKIVRSSLDETQIIAYIYKIEAKYQNDRGE